ncbi:MAG: zinc ribbon domain-containing protein [Bacteroidota bacterium]|nr:zinc ribbon domain-containing protein [Bacteroidota bacterium]
MIYCANCGFGLQNDATFCPECGKKNEGKATTIPAGTSTVVTPIVEEVPTALEIPVTPVAPLVETSPTPKQFCRNCGNDVSAGSFACLKCGLPPMKAFNFCPSCGSNCHQDAVICIKCGVKLESQDSVPKAAQTQEIKKAFCKNCGKEVLKDAVACLNCGLPPNKSKNFCPSCGSDTHNEAVICIKCGTALEQFAAQQIQQTSAGVSKPASNQTSNVVIVGTQKSVGTAFILAFLFGPLGLLYASVVGGFIMFFVGLLSFFVLPLVGYILVHIVCIIWAIVAAQNSNQNALNQAGTIANNMNRQ